MQINSTKNLLGIKDINLNILNFFENNTFMLFTVSMKRVFHTCPNCGNSTNKIHDYRNPSFIKHSTINGKIVYIKYRKRRYVCSHCNKRFTENNSFINKYSKISNLAKQQILHEVKFCDSFVSVAKKCNLSLSTVHRHFSNHVYHSKPSSLPCVLCIDEFSAHTHAGKYATIIVDFDKRSIFDIIPTRRKADLLDYFLKFPLSQRKKVEIVNIDMSYNFRAVIKRCFPNAVIVADKFHYVRYLTKAVNDVRIKVMKSFNKKSIEYRLLKRHWGLLLKRYDQLDDSKFFRDPTLKGHITKRRLVDIMLSFSNDLVKAFDIKDEFYNIIDLGSSISLDDTINLIDDLIIKIRDLNDFRFKNVLSMFRNWKHEIINSFKHKHYDNRNYTNSIAEGFNNKIKVIKRNAYGFHSFKNFLLRIAYKFDLAIITS